jgi:TfoX/Sxy family transcriptional regulator of competence genes
MAYDAGLVERVREILAELRGIREKPMFGMLVFFRDDVTFAGVAGDDLLVRVGPEAFRACVAQPHVRPMEIGHRMKTSRSYVLVAPDGVDYEDDLRRWIDRGLAFVATRPPKAAKARSSAKPRRKR